ncbi:MAG: hypothetical protein FJ211_03330 [Ignavibacteria bacterium]|nr:hypothetical protein [Ignavibacteria bacterium]
MKRLLSLIGMSALALTACSDPATPEPTAESYVASAGSYMIHQNTELAIDTATQKVTETPAPSDSTVTGAVTTFNGKSSTPFFMHVGGAVQDTTYYYQEGSNLFTSIPLSYDIGGIPLDLGSKWAKIYDQATSWTALSDTVTPIDLPGGQYKLSAKLNFSGQSQGTESVTINGVTLIAKKVQINLDARLYAMLGPTSIPVDVNLKVLYWIADKVGVIKREQPATILNLGLLGQLMGSPVQAVPGFREVTTKYVIK